MYLFNFWKRGGKERGYATKVVNIDAGMEPFVRRDYPFTDWEAFKLFRRKWHGPNAFAEFSYVFFCGLAAGAVLVIIAAFLLFPYLGLQIVR